MMRKLSAVCMLLLSVAICPRLWAQHEERGQVAERARHRLSERLGDLDLSDEQESKIEEIRKQHRPKIEEAAKELRHILREEANEVRAALTPEQNEKLTVMKEEMRERWSENLAERLTRLDELHLTDEERTRIESIRKAYRPKVVKAMRSMTGILDEDQRHARDKALQAGEKRSEVIKSLNLSESQKQKLETASKELGGLFKSELEEIVAVLSPEQVRTAERGHEERREERRERWRRGVPDAISQLDDLNLSEEQRDIIQEIRDEFRPKVENAANKLRAAVREEASQILQVIREKH